MQHTAWAFTLPTVLCLSLQTSSTAVLRSRQGRTKQAPFVTSFQVQIDGGLDNSLIADKLYEAISANSKAVAAVLAGSVARTPNHTFPHIANKSDLNTAVEAMTLARRAHDVAEENGAALGLLRATIEAATDSHAKALKLGRLIPPPLSTTTTASDMPNVGRIVYAALMSTPAPHAPVDFA